MQHRVHGREYNVWWIYFSSKNISHIYCTSSSLFNCMVGNIMFVEFPFRQKTFLAFTALRIHGTIHDVYWISFSSKNVYHIYCTSSSWYTHDVCWISFSLKNDSHIYCTSSSWYTHDVCWISFSLKNVSHIYCMLQPMMFVEFPFRQKIFSTSFSTWFFIISRNL